MDSTTPPPPTEHTRALEALHVRMCTASAGLAYMDFSDHGGGGASPADIAETTRELATAKAELHALVSKLRAEAPQELDAWAFAHYCYISQFLHDCAERRDDADVTRVTHAMHERGEWALVREGKRDFVEGSSWVPKNETLYRRYFGID